MGRDGGPEIALGLAPWPGPGLDLDLEPDPASRLPVAVLAELWVVMDRCAVISKREIFWLWPFGLAAWLWGTIFIDRLNPERAQSTVNRTGQRVLKEKVRQAIGDNQDKTSAHAA